MEIHFLAINIDPENHQFLMETSLPTPMTARVYVNLPEGNFLINPTVIGVMFTNFAIVKPWQKSVIINHGVNNSDNCG